MSHRLVSTLAGCLLLLAAQAGLGWQTGDKDKAKDKTTPAPFTGDPSGRPKEFKTGAATLCAIWHDGESWNIQTTGKKLPKGPSPYHRWGGSVRIEGDTFSGTFGKLEKAKKITNADYVVPHADGRGFDFQLVNRGGRDDLKFKAGAKATEITMKIVCDNMSDTKKILIGRKGENPEKTLFTLPAHPKKKSAKEP